MMPITQLAKLDIWFILHRHAMQLVSALSLIGFYFVFAAKYWTWVAVQNVKGFAHSIGGVLALLLVFVQPVIAYFRPGKYDDNRPWFNFLHRSIGLLAYLLASKTIF